MNFAEETFYVYCFHLNMFNSANKQRLCIKLCRSMFSVEDVLIFYINIRSVQTFASSGSRKLLSLVMC